jgi:hypothetical protein
LKNLIVINNRLHFLLNTISWLSVNCFIPSTRSVVEISLKVLFLKKLMVVRYPLPAKGDFLFQILYIWLAFRSYCHGIFINHWTNFSNFSTFLCFMLSNFGFLGTLFSIFLNCSENVLLNSFFIHQILEQYLNSHLPLPKNSYFQ